MASIIVRFTPMVITMGVIFFLSHQPGDSFEPYLFPWIDKLGHLVVYGLLGLSVIYAFPDQYRPVNKGLVSTVVLIVCLLYGVSDEFHQSFVPGRFPSVYDLVADVAGAVLACLLWGAMTKKSRDVE